MALKISFERYQLALLGEVKGKELLKKALNQMGA